MAAGPKALLPTVSAMFWDSFAIARRSAFVDAAWSSPLVSLTLGSLSNEYARSFLSPTIVAATSVIFRSGVILRLSAACFVGTNLSSPFTSITQEDPTTPRTGYRSLPTVTAMSAPMKSVCVFVSLTTTLSITTGLSSRTPADCGNAAAMMETAGIRAHHGEGFIGFCCLPAPAPRLDRQLGKLEWRNAVHRLSPFERGLEADVSYDRLQVGIPDLLGARRVEERLVRQAVLRNFNIERVAVFSLRRAGGQVGRQLAHNGHGGQRVALVGADIFHLDVLKCLVARELHTLGRDVGRDLFPPVVQVNIEALQLERRRKPFLVEVNGNRVVAYRAKRFCINQPLDRSRAGTPRVEPGDCHHERVLKPVLGGNLKRHVHRLIPQG